MDFESIVGVKNKVKGKEPQNSYSKTYERYKKAYSKIKEKHEGWLWTSEEEEQAAIEEASQYYRDTARDDPNNPQIVLAAKRAFVNVFGCEPRYAAQPLEIPPKTEIQEQKKEGESAGGPAGKETSQKELQTQLQENIAKLLEKVNLTPTQQRQALPKLDNFNAMLTQPSTPKGQTIKEGYSDFTTFTSLLDQLVEKNYIHPIQYAGKGPKVSENEGLKEKLKETTKKGEKPAEELGAGVLESALLTFGLSFGIGAFSKLAEKGLTSPQFLNAVSSKLGGRAAGIIGAGAGGFISAGLFIGQIGLSLAQGKGIGETLLQLSGLTKGWGGIQKIGKGFELIGRVNFSAAQQIFTDKQPKNELSFRNYLGLNIEGLALIIEGISDLISMVVTIIQFIANVCFVVAVIFAIVGAIGAIFGVGAGLLSLVGPLIKAGMFLSKIASALDVLTYILRPPALALHGVAYLLVESNPEAEAFVISNFNACAKDLLGAYAANAGAKLGGAFGGEIGGRVFGQGKPKIVGGKVEQQITPKKTETKENMGFVAKTKENLSKGKDFLIKDIIGWDISKINTEGRKKLYDEGKVIGEEWKNILKKDASWRQDATQIRDDLDTIKSLKKYEKSKDGIIQSINFHRQNEYSKNGLRRAEAKKMLDDIESTGFGVRGRRGDLHALIVKKADGGASDAEILNALEPYITIPNGATIEKIKLAGGSFGGKGEIDPLPVVNKDMKDFSKQIVKAIMGKSTNPKVQMTLQQAYTKISSSEHQGKGLAQMETGEVIDMLQEVLKMKKDEATELTQQYLSHEEGFLQTGSDVDKTLNERETLFEKLLTLDWANNDLIKYYEDLCVEEKNIQTLLEDVPNAKEGVENVNTGLQNKKSVHQKGMVENEAQSGSINQGVQKLIAEMGKILEALPGDILGALNKPEAREDGEGIDGSQQGTGSALEFARSTGDVQTKTDTKHTTDAFNAQGEAINLTQNSINEGKTYITSWEEMLNKDLTETLQGKMTILQRLADVQGNREQTQGEIKTKEAKYEELTGVLSTTSEKWKEESNKLMELYDDEASLMQAKTDLAKKDIANFVG